MVLMGLVRKIGLFSQPSRADRDRALVALDYFGLGDLALRPFHEMSGGQRQLVIFARVLLADADIVILDEPTSALDLRNQSLVIDWIRRLSRQHDMTVIFTTHQPNHALAAADEALVMLSKTRLAFGPAADVLDEGDLSRLYGVPLKRFSVEHEGKTFTQLAPLI
ncbi:ABC transporter ATP-binding protein [Hyphomicrobium sp.]|uniref:ABC transporter ATP-binding protein n=1 Tax=Hyphomicrobium sp. TaxID=82 RepID=UPI002FE1CB15